MADLPTGVITFLFTDIEGSTRLWEQHPQAMQAALARHDALARALLRAHEGFLVKHRGEGDSLFAVFPRAVDAVAAACALQRALLAEPWPDALPLRVRMALHTGDAAVRDGDYFGGAVNRCARLRAAAHGGQVLLSGATQEVVHCHLPQGTHLRDLGAHQLKDLQQPEHIFQLLHPDLPGDFPPLRSLEAFAHNLPRQLTSFIGREDELSRIKQLLANTALLTLTGAGGCGKTRLALQVAADLLNQYREGVWLVELAALSDPALVPQAVASALGVREEPHRPLTQTVIDYLRPRQLLLVLDNCEHLLSACAQLAESVLRSSSQVRILATSRERLGIAGETIRRVPSLSLPDPERPPTADALAQFEAAKLFVERAIAAAPSFAVTDANASAVAQVCLRLDGIPLAIELAAARAKVLSVDQIAARMDDFFRLLTGGSRTALPRQQTLRALIDWSHDLLSEPERALLRRLSVFAGGWTLEAAEAVCAGDGVELWEVLDLLSGLVEKSLVIVEERTGGEPRYRLLETVRQFSAEQLLGAGDAVRVRELHAKFYMALAEKSAPHLARAERGVWVERLEVEHDNMRAALAWSLSEAGDAETSLRLSGALYWFWYFRGHIREALEWLRGALAQGEGESPPRLTRARATALYAAGVFCWHQGDYETAHAFLERSVAMARGIEDGSVLGMALVNLGLVLRDLGDYAAARSHLEECVSMTPDPEYAWHPAWALLTLGTVAYRQGDYAEARGFHEKGLATARKLADPWITAWALINLGDAVRRMGDDEQATGFYRECLTLFSELGNRQGMAYALEALGGLAVARGRWTQGVRLFGAAEALREAVGARMSPADADEYARSVEVLRAALGPTEFSAEWAEGRAMTLEQAVAYALDGIDASSREGR